MDSKLRWRCVPLIWRIFSSQFFSSERASVNSATELYAAGFHILMRNV
jgi:hypothetical protein